MAYSKIDMRGIREHNCPFRDELSVVCADYDIESDTDPELIQFICICDRCKDVV